MRIRFAFLISLFLSLVLTPLFRKVALRCKILDVPDKRKLHKTSMPLLGGAAVYLSFIFSVGPLLAAHRNLIGLISAGTLILVSGLIDDIKGLSAVFRLLVQFAASAIVIASGIVLSFLPNTFLGNLGEVILTVIWLIGITNAMNYLDGIDGLLASLTVSSALCFLFIAYTADQFLLGYLAAALIGSCLGFLKYNFSPARIFLGDAGSTFIGFMMASIAVMGNWAEDNFVSIFVPVFILGVPIFDMTLTTIMRVKEKKVKDIMSWLAHTGRDHFHHRLLNLGFGPRAVVLFITTISLSIGISGILLKRESISTAIFMLLQAAIIFVHIGILMVVSARKVKDV